MGQNTFPKTWMTEAILVTLFCCFPCGVISIIYASKVSTRLSRGDEDGAYEASRKAEMWVKISFWSIPGLCILSAVLYVLTGILMFSSR